MAITVKAPAKLNITLDVVGEREDGYHLLDMIVQTVSLCDTLDIELTDDGKITLWEDSENLPVDESNLAFAAAKLILSRAGSNKGACIKLKKAIPVAAGLGGGSSDAAAVLKGINALLGDPFSVDELAQMSLPLGADVPMCVMGGCMRAKGIGEDIYPIGKMPECWIVITKNGQKPSTGEMYRRLGQVGINKRPDNNKVEQAILSGNIKKMSEEIYNVFLPVYDSDVVIQEIELLKKTDALGVGLSGSGPSVFAVFAEESSALRTAEKLKAAGKTAYICQPVE